MKPYCMHYNMCVCVLWVLTHWPVAAILHLSSWNSLSGNLSVWAFENSEWSSFSGSLLWFAARYCCCKLIGSSAPVQLYIPHPLPLFISTPSFLSHPTHPFGSLADGGKDVAIVMWQHIATILVLPRSEEGLVMTSSQPEEEEWKRSYIRTRHVHNVHSS